MNRRNRIVCLLGAVVMIAVLGGCFGTSPSARFYTLTPRESRGISAVEGLDMVVRVGPVSIPSYIDRRQIVTRNGRNQIEIAEYERWGGPIDDEILRLLVNNLSGSTATKGISVVPWRSVTMADAATIYRIPVSIDRFDGVPGESVLLSAFWAVVSIKDKQENVLVARQSMIREAVDGKGYDALVAAMGRAVERLGNEIADSVTAHKSRTQDQINKPEVVK
ncbi:MAG: membrane integrity-associated transporter subunit PqiC [Deltaproteobacteria bacterium]|nr:membrane integrity-associated transporter subunit PqiC [Deltaproteobacteria bacterium]